MNTDGQSHDGDRGARPADNVVRLHDWLGPRDELVPFGPAADARARQPSESLDISPDASAFWSESSASVHDALPASAPDDPAPAAWPPRRTGHSAEWLARAAHSAARRRLAWTGMATVAAVVVIALMGRSDPQTATREPAPATVARAPVPSRAESSKRPPGHSSAWAQETALRLHALRVSLARASRRVAAARAHREASRLQRRAATATATATATSTVLPVRYTRAASTSSSGQSSASPGASPSPPTTATVPAGTTTVSASSSRAPSRAHTALGADGTLAPGNSPDG